MGQCMNKLAIGFKLLAAGLSFPVPPESYCPGTEVVDGVDDKNKPKSRQQDPQSKLLLVGCDQSGTSTLFQQAKFIHNVPFSEDELLAIKFMIQRNLYTYMAILFEFQHSRSSSVHRRGIQSPSSNQRIITDDGVGINPQQRAGNVFLKDG